MSPARPKIGRGGVRNMPHWIAAYGDDLRVLAWEAANPPPPEWVGPPHSFAFRYMPKPEIGARIR
jgi:hypothetical protein